MEFFIPIIIGGVIGLIIYNARNAGKNNGPREYVYQCSQARLTEAIIAAANNLKYTVENVDKISGRIRLGIGMSAATFGEWMDIQLMELTPEKTKLTVSCRAKRGRENIGKNIKNIEKFLDALSNVLSH